MASLDAIRREYLYAFQDRGAILELINGDPPSPPNDVRDRAVSEAINHYSIRVPRTKVVLVSPISTGSYPLPADWQNWSRIVTIENPIDQNPPVYLSQKSIAYRNTETQGYYVLLPNPTASFRLAYLTVHGGGIDNCASIDAIHEPLIGKWAASIACIEAAARYAKSQQNNVDAVNYRTKEQECRAVAGELKALVDRELRAYEWSLLYRTDADASYHKPWRT